MVVSGIVTRPKHLFGYKYFLDTLFTLSGDIPAKICVFLHL